MIARSVPWLDGYAPLWVVQHGGGRETTPGGVGLGSGMAVEGNGLGLIGMRERVMALGGQLDIIDLVDRGFRLHAMNSI